MGKFDFNKAPDFARSTMSDVRGIIEQFAGRDPNLWDLEEGSYNGILFHVFKSSSEYQGELASVTDTGGRRKVKYMFPYQDGQTTDDLGRRPEQFDADILIHGDRYTVGLQSLLQELNKPTPGVLVHPIRGQLQVVPQDWTLTHQSDSRKAVIIKVTFIEHNFTIGDVRISKDKSVKGFLNKALDAFAAIDRVLARVQAATQFVFSVRQSVVQALANYKNGYAQVLGRMNTTFNGGNSADIPGLLPVNQGGLLNPDGSNSSPFFPSLQTEDKFNAVPLSSLQNEVPATIAANDITKQVNALRADLADTINDMKAMGGGVGSLEFHDEILDLKQTAVDLQRTLEAGVASSQALVIDYTVPRVMSIREIAFANGLSPNRSGEIDLLNPALLSVNFIPEGTLVRVPIS
jgi:hypothetical protein